MSESLQEFVVSLKYKQEGQRQFIDGVESAGKKVLKLGEQMATAIAGISLGVAKYAQGMEQLKFVSDRTGTSVKNLRALETAGASMGSTAEGAKSSLEGLAKFMRNTPGSSSFLASIGVQTKDAKGHALDTVAIMKNLGSAFRKMPVYMANQYAGMLGIDDNMMLAMRNKNFDSKVDKYEATLKGGHLGETANSAHTAMDKGRVLGLKAEWLKSRASGPMLDKFNELDTATHGLSTEIGAVTLGLVGMRAAASGVTSILKAIAGKAAPVAVETEAATGAAVGAGAVSLLGKAGLIGAAGAGGYWLGGKLNKNFIDGTSVGDYIGYEETQALALFGNKDAQDAIRANSHAQRSASGKIRRLHPTLEKYLNGIRWAESRGNPNAVSPAGAKGAYQLMPATANEMGVNPFNESASRLAAGSMLARLRKRYNGNMTQALQAYNWGQGNMDSYLKTGYGVHHQAMPRETQNYPGQVAKGMTQNITINIPGSGDPKATGREVHRQIQLAARNTAGMTR